MPESVGLGISRSDEVHILVEQKLIVPSHRVNGCQRVRRQEVNRHRQVLIAGSCYSRHVLANGWELDRIVNPLLGLPDKGIDLIGRRKATRRRWEVILSVAFYRRDELCVIQNLPHLPADLTTLGSSAIPTHHTNPIRIDWGVVALAIKTSGHV
jgi:hypothetical protein